MIDVAMLEKHYSDFGYDETVRFILQSREEQYLNTAKDISKIMELVTLAPRQRSIVKYLNYLEDKKRTIVPPYSITNDTTNATKLSKRQIKYLEEKINRLPLSELSFLKSFIGVLELNLDGMSLARAKVKVQKIKALYIAKIPLNNINIKDVVEALNSKGVNSSEQDVIVFLSLIIELSYDGEYVNIPAPFWEKLFGYRNIKKAKIVFQNIGILREVSKYIPGFKSARYKVELYNSSSDIDRFDKIIMEITSINTLERLNRIKVYRGNFSLKGKVEALELINELRMREIKRSGSFNLTKIFLESGRLQRLINDLARMIDIMNDNRYYKVALSLGIHLTAYFDNIGRRKFKDYNSYFSKEKN